MWLRRAGKTWSFINRVSDSHQVEEPDWFYGGIVADLIGFGKTLIIIALVATDLSNSPQLTPGTRLGDKFEGDPGYTSPQILIIIPPSRT
jgi:SWI/SNF-related matrix-associated actin-dependent regulator of chromatin subfamily A3